jgi:hypothetical protein
MSLRAAANLPEMALKRFPGSSRTYLRRHGVYNYLANGAVENPTRKRVRGIVKELRSAHRALKGLPFTDLSDLLLIERSVESLCTVAARVTRIDEILYRTSNKKCRPAFGQAGIAGWVEQQSEPELSWYRQLVAERAPLDASLVNAYRWAEKMHQQAVWMQHSYELSVKGEVAAGDSAAGLDAIREAAQLTQALAEGVGELHELTAALA